MIYSRIIPIEFNHCDPAGIVFYPRYFEMTNSVVENFFGEALGYPFSQIAVDEGRGVPTVRIETNFHAPARLGEKLEFGLQVMHIGRTSVGFRLVARGAGADRLSADLTLVHIDPQGKPEPWPAKVREKMTKYQGDEHEPA